MNTLFHRAGFAAWLLGFAHSAAAHVSYVDLSDPVQSPGGINGSAFSNFGWYDGTTAALGDSHALAEGLFFRFHLATASSVSIGFSDSSGTGALNPAFSLYAGVLPDEAHDDALADPLNPSHLETTPAPHLVKDPSPVDDGVTTDAFGRVSPFRDTQNLTFLGQFDALHSWSMANESGDWSVLDYLTHVAPTGGSSVSLLNYLLPAGDYTIAAAGGTADGTLTGLAGTLSFTATPVPAPAAVWLLGSGLAGLGAVLRRRRPHAAGGGMVSGSAG